MFPKMAELFSVIEICLWTFWMYFPFHSWFAFTSKILTHPVFNSELQWYTLPESQQILLENGWLAYYCHFPFWGLASFQEVMLNNGTPIPILLPYHSQREFLQVWEWYGKLSFRECTTTLTLNSTCKVSPFTLNRCSRSGSQRDEASNEDHEDWESTGANDIFFHHHKWFLSVDPSLKILGNVSVIDSDCRNFH